ncbi:MAG: hypothetical protein A2020_13760 [Lentisphaerae bacterium GWF2_45_14]|nr:MAG: hypothetical protein A2020_13760 [Lentisphaerae bacterium GWF2_45_14]
MSPQLSLELLHFQLTSRCNLACSFCGQWGEHGFNRKKTVNDDISPEIWLKAARSVADYCRQRNIPLPSLELWGGEPLLYRDFDTLIPELGKLGFRIGLVSNGSMLQEKAELINEYVKVLFVSIDGFGEEHDRIRRSPGLFKKIEEGLLAIGPHVKKSALCVISSQNRKLLPELPLKLENLNLDNLIVQNLIFTNEADAEKYRQWLSSEFSIEARNVSSWINDDWKSYIDELPEIIRIMKGNISRGVYRLDTCILPREETPENVLDWYCAQDGIKPEENQAGFCITPFKHMQVLADGRITPCVDFNDFYAGNIVTDNIIDVWQGKLMEKFRHGIQNGCNPLCKRCPWRYNTSFCMT